MNFFTITIAAFMVLETLNVLILYFAPESRKGNGIGAFKVLAKAKKDPEVYELVKYLVYWVAGVKVIFIALLFVVLLKGNYEVQSLALIALIFSTLTFYWRMYPSIKSMDMKGLIIPKGYSKKLATMILVFIVVFGVAWIAGHLPPYAI